LDRSRALRWPVSGHGLPGIALGFVLAWLVSGQGVPTVVEPEWPELRGRLGLRGRRQIAERRLARAGRRVEAQADRELVGHLEQEAPDARAAAWSPAAEQRSAFELRAQPRELLAGGVVRAGSEHAQRLGLLSGRDRAPGAGPLAPQVIEAHRAPPRARAASP